MMGFGGTAGGSSNLSAWAIPFTLDRSYPPPPASSWDWPLYSFTSPASASAASPSPPPPTWFPQPSVNATYADPISTDAGAHTSQGQQMFEEISNMPVPHDSEKLNHRYSLGECLTFMPVDSLHWGSTSLPNKPLLPVELPAPPEKSMNYDQASFASAPLKSVGGRELFSGEITSVVKSSHGFNISYQAQNANTCFDTTDIPAIALNSSNVNEPHHFLFSASKVNYDPTHLGFHLNDDNHVSVESSSVKSAELSRSRIADTNPSGFLFENKSGYQVSHNHLDGFSRPLDMNKAVSPLNNSVDDLDNYNPVDSPCWKGAPVWHNSPFENPGFVGTERVKNLEACNDMNGQETQCIFSNVANAARISSENQNELFGSEINVCWGYGSVPSPKRPSVGVMSFKGHQSNGKSKNGGSLYRMQSCGYEAELLADIADKKKENVQPQVNEPEFKPSHTMKKNAEEGKVASQISFTSETGFSVDTMQKNGSSKNGSSRMSFCAAKDVVSKPFAWKDVPTNHANMSEKKSTPKVNIPVLVDTMNNLAELLLFHCSKGECELKEKDYKTLEKVRTNIDACLSKNIRQGSLVAYPYEDMNIGKSKCTIFDVVGRCDYLNSQENHKNLGKEDEKFFAFSGVRDGADMKVKNEKMTQAIKYVLAENFEEEAEENPQDQLYKNLWLEAEAALCLINYKARFNHMKIEMEKSKAHAAKDLSMDTVVDEEMLGSQIFTEKKAEKESGPTTKGGSAADICHLNFPGTNSNGSAAHDVVSRYFILKSRADNANSVAAGDLEEPQPSSKVSPNFKKVHTDISHPNSHTTNSSGHADDVVSRHLIVKSRVDNTNSVMVGHMEEPRPTCKVSPDFDQVDKLAPEASHSLDLESSAQKSLAKGETNDSEDVEASVMAKFRVLKSCSNNMSSVNAQPEIRDHGFAGGREDLPITEDTSVDVISNLSVQSFLQNQEAKANGGPTALRELFVEHDSLVQSLRSNGPTGQTYAGWYDGSSSDWEHVLKEELSG